MHCFSATFFGQTLLSEEKTKQQHLCFAAQKKAKCEAGKGGFLTYQINLAGL